MRSITYLPLCPFQNSSNQPNNMILITKIETKEVPESYAQVCSKELLHSPQSSCEAVDGAGEPCYADAGTYTTETVRGRRFTRNQWNKEKQEVETISDVTIGMTADVQNVLGMQVEEWEDMESDLVLSKSKVCMLEGLVEMSNKQVLNYVAEALERDNMNLWQRLKWAITKK